MNTFDVKQTAAFLKMHPDEVRHRTRLELLAGAKPCCSASEYRQEAASLADDNEWLTAELDDLRKELVQAVSDKAAAEGRTMQLARELAAARE